MQGNVRRLIELQSQTIADNYEFTSFGEELSKAAASGPFNPWRFASKRFDPELGLIYFGKRYYDPEFARWLTPDPAGFIDSVNLYQYVLNNPFKYVDPRGENLFGFFCGIGQILAGGALLASGTFFEIATCGAYTIGFVVQTQVGLGLMASGCAQAVCHAQDISFDIRPYHRPRDDFFNIIGKRHTPDQEALSDLVKGSGKQGVSDTDADALLEWAKEYDFPARDDRGEDHWEYGKHIHIGQNKHIKVN